MHPKSARPALVAAALLALYPAISAETWLLEGSWDYYVVCDSSYRPAFRTASNSIEVYRELGDGRVIVRSSARMVDARRGAALPAAPPEGMESSLDPWYRNDQAKALALEGLARSIVGDAATVEAAVDRLGAWIRNKVTYNLGVSTDPLEVARNGRAYCEGYANLAVGLFRAAGIPAVKLSCYIPPGNGWGSGGSGGNHAFLAYYYPGVGWLCHDPQSSSGYVDPFHLVGFVGKVHAQYRRPPDARVTGFTEEPKAWGSYSSGSAGGDRRGFALGMTDVEGRPVPFSALLAVSGTVLDPSREYFERNIFGESWCSLGSGQGLAVRADASRASVCLAGSAWRGYFASPGTWPESGAELLSLSGRGMLGLRQVDLGAGPFLSASFDFADGKAMSVRLRDPASGSPLSRRSLKVRIDGTSIGAETDAEGWLLVSCLDADGSPRRDLGLAIEQGGAEYSFAYEAGRAISLPGQSAREGALQAALAEARSSSTKPRLRLVVRDRAGEADASIVGAASLFLGSAERRMASRGGLFLEADGLSAGASYLLRARVGGVEVQRLVGPIRDGEGTELEIRQSDLKPMRLWRENPFESSAFTLYEYFDDAASPWPLHGSDGRVLWDCPEGEHLVSDNVIRANVLRLAARRGEDLSYEPGVMDLEAYRFAEAFRRGTGAIVAGRARDEAGPLRSGSALLVGEGGSISRNLAVDARGFFSCPGLAPSSRYLVAFAGQGLLCLRSFATDEKGGALLDLDLGGESIPCSTDYARGRDRPDRIQLLVPAMAEGAASLKSFALSTGRRFRLYVDGGDYLLSTETTVMGAASIVAGRVDGRRDRAGILCLAPDRSEPGYLERSRRIVARSWPGAADLILVGFGDAFEGGWKSATVELRSADATMRPRFDSQGFAQIAAKPGTRLSFRYERRGLSWEGSLEVDEAGPSVVVLASRP